MESKPMKLRELKLELARWGEFEGRYTASIEYEGKNGSVKATLDPEISDKLLAFIGPVLAAFTHQSAVEIEASFVKSLGESKYGKPIELNPASNNQQP